jgi:hypothetical protein
MQDNRPNPEDLRAAMVAGGAAGFPGTAAPPSPENLRAPSIAQAAGGLPGAAAPPDPENLRAAMEAAWRDHHHARDQTWKLLAMVALLAAGLVVLDGRFANFWLTLCAGVLVAIAAACAAGVTLNHRKLERRKFIHIANCEELLGLHRDDVIPLSKTGREEYGVSSEGYEKRTSRAVRTDLLNDSEVQLPPRLSLGKAFSPRVNNTGVFILRMHLAIIVFAALLVFARWAWPPQPAGEVDARPGLRPASAAPTKAPPVRSRRPARRLRRPSSR